jgi:membrane protein YqaA with SNARE-associated domain
LEQPAPAPIDRSPSIHVSTTPSRTRRRIPWQPLLTLAGTLALTVVLVALPFDAARWGAWSYGALFVLTLLSSATIILPSPALAAALKASTTLDPLLVGLIGGLAAGIGEMTGYLAGRSGSELVLDRPLGRRVEGWVRRWGMLTVFLLAAIPLPLIDLAGVAAGSLRLGFWRFQAACIAGKTVRFLLVAFLGHMFLGGNG